MTPTLLANTKTLWYVTRGSGVVALLLLTASIALGVPHRRTLARPALPPLRRHRHSIAT